MTAYYNEIDPYAAEWLRNLIKAGHIADGVVDERSIEDVRPDDLTDFVQCHFFAGIGVWSGALRRADWPDDRPVWTGSCPCQPFSKAGKGDGFDDERHLWPAWQHLISQCGPVFIFGEQVRSADSERWVDLVQADLEALGYAFGAVAFPSCSVGAPHDRPRVFWMADAWGAGLARQFRYVINGGRSGRLGAGSDGPAGEKGGSGGVADLCSPGRGIVGRGGLFGHHPWSNAYLSQQKDRAGPVNGFWSDADWIICHDPNGPRWRPVESGSSPLVDGSASRMGRLCAYGNAINLEQAAHFILAADDAARSIRGLA